MTGIARVEEVASATVAEHTAVAGLVVDTDTASTLVAEAGEVAAMAVDTAMDTAAAATMAVDITGVATTVAATGVVQHSGLDSATCLQLATTRTGIQYPATFIHRTLTVQPPIRQGSRSQLWVSNEGKARLRMRR